MNDCLNCGDHAHGTDTCPRPRHVYIEELRPTQPDQLHKCLTVSLEGATRGRRIGWRLAQSKAASIALSTIKDSEEGIRVYNLIMDLTDK